MTDLFDEFPSTVLFSLSFCLYRAFFTHLISSNLSCNLCLRYYDQLVHFDKEIHLWEYSKRFHCSFEWHLTPHMTDKHYLSKHVLGGHPVLSGHYSVSRGCPLNTGFTVNQNLERKKNFFAACLRPQEKLLIRIFYVFKPCSVSKEIRPERTCSRNVLLVSSLLKPIS